MREPLLDLVSELYPLRRTLVSDGTDEALERVRADLGPNIRYDVKRFPRRERMDVARAEPRRTAKMDCLNHSRG